MQSTDRSEFSELITDVMAFYKQDLSRFAIGIWWEACQAFDLPAIRRSFGRHVADPERGQYPPRPADVVRDLMGSKQDNALLAWSRVCKAASEVGAYQSVDFGDGAIHAAIVDMGGWPEFCRTEVEQMPFVQKRFCDAYRAHAARAADVPRLVGDHARSNARIAGYEAKVVRVGNVDLRIGA